LHLLKRQPERIGDGRLRNAEVEPSYFKAATDFTIRSRRTSLSHKFTFSTAIEEAQELSPIADSPALASLDSLRSKSRS
jgi:hypothetical protein